MAGIHPSRQTNVTCGCGNKFSTRSTKKNISRSMLDLYPFFPRAK